MTYCFPLQVYTINLGIKAFSGLASKSTFMETMRSLHLWDEEIWLEGALELDDGLRLSNDNNYKSRVKCLNRMMDKSWPGGFDFNTCLTTATTDDCKQVCKFMETTAAAVKDPRVEKVLVN